MKLRKEIFFDSDESYENSQCRASKDQTEMANCDGVVLFCFFNTLPGGSEAV